MRISLIFAMDENNAIGLNNSLPWHLPADLKHFKRLTTGNIIVMGRKTYESIGKPLPNRTNIVLTQQTDFQVDGITVLNSIEEAIEYSKKHNAKELFFIGGAQVAKKVLPIADRFYLTRIHHKFEADTFLPFDESEWKVSGEQHFSPDEKNAYSYSFYTLDKN